MNKLSDSEMWRAAIENDAGFDGVFYYAVKSTGIVCRPSCRSKAPRRENVTFFTLLQDAINTGYRPCKRCRPDLGDGFDPEGEVINKACQILGDEYANPDILAELPARVGVSLFHFQRMFKKVTGITPRAFLQRIRVEKAIALIHNTELTNTVICYDVGFKSLSSFYTVFRQLTEVSPKEYRKN